MSKLLRPFWTMAVLFCAAMVLPAVAAEKAKPAPAAETPEPPDPFRVPEGTPEELFKYISGLQKEPSNLAPEAAEEFAKKASRAIVKAADKILAAKITDEQAETAARTKMIGLALLEQAGDEDAGKRLDALPAELQKAGRAKLARQVRAFLFQKQLRAALADAELLEKVLKDIKQYVADAPVEKSDVRLILTAAQIAEMSGKVELAVDAYTSFAKVLAASKDEEVAGLAKTMEGVVRRLTLVGNKIKVEGKLLGGEALDWSKYAGKVVLVDFWATWCQPCVREVPNLKKNYELFHPRGFEVIGISLDREREPLESFLKEKQIPWTIVYDDDGENATAAYYGVMSIPTMILVGKDGKVVTTTARGPQLRAQLEKLLGPAVEKKVEPKKEQPKE